ncbi:MAG: hypothetical protein ACI8Y7_000867 [Candidatus Woesearchaeota archaeon]|jgi:hypothetical protein
MARDATRRNQRTNSGRSRFTPFHENERAGVVAKVDYLQARIDMDGPQTYALMQRQSTHIQTMFKKWELDFPSEAIFSRLARVADIADALSPLNGGPLESDILFGVLQNPHTANLYHGLGIHNHVPKATLFFKYCRSVGTGGLLDVYRGTKPRRFGGYAGVLNLNARPEKPPEPETRIYSRR